MPIAPPAISRSMSGLAVNVERHYVVNGKGRLPGKYRLKWSRSPGSPQVAGDADCEGTGIAPRELVAAARPCMRSDLR
jgi:hypothetical protein